MTLHDLWKRLRVRNQRDYRQFCFCITFAAALISSYLILVMSPLVQGALPRGGDSGKMVFLILGIAVLGCSVFVWYAARIFLRYKSRETGIFLALGADRGMLKKDLSLEMSGMTARYAARGLLFGMAVSFVAGKALEAVTRKYQASPFAFTGKGMFCSLLYLALLLMLVSALTVRSMGRTNVMDVIYEQRKQEPLRKSVTRKYLISGILWIVIGIFVAYCLNPVLMSTWGIYTGTWVNAFYLLAVLGLYRVLVYSVSCHQRGQNPQKYYDNLLYYGMMKFQGASVVKNMLVITLLLMGGLFALFYMPLMMSGSIAASYEAEYSFRYLNNAKEPGKEELAKIAREEGTELLEYREGEFIRVTGSGVDRDVNEEGDFTEDYYKKFAEYDCTSAKQYERMTGIRLDIPQGGYYLIQPPDAKEETWFQFDDMDRLYLAAGDGFISMRYLGNAEYSALVITPDNGLGHGSRFVVNDADYRRLREGLPDEKLETQVLFDTADGDGKIAFAKRIFKEFAARMSEEMNVNDYYNPVERARIGGTQDSIPYKAVVDPGNPLAERDWQYDMMLAPLIAQQNVMGISVRYLLFVYVALICFAAVGVIGISRSQSVGMASRQFFEDMKKLGADREYRRRLMKKQIQKIYVLPTALGTGTMLGYSVLILYTNDGVLKPYEVTVAFILLALCMIIVICQYMLYRKSEKAVEKLLG